MSYGLRTVYEQCIDIREPHSADSGMRSGPGPERFVTEYKLPYLLEGLPELRWGNVKELSA